jgi:D-lactate dehydrogenase (cytochrome)
MCGVVHHGVNSLQKIKSLNVEDMDVVVEPGVGWIELNEYLKPYGLFFPLDPGKVLVLCS